MTAPPFDGKRPAASGLLGEEPLMPADRHPRLSNDRPVRLEAGGGALEPAEPAEPADISEALPAGARWAPTGPPSGTASGSGPGWPAAAQPKPTLAGGSIEPLNLARHPFVNTRPVVRVATILWLLGLVLLVTNVALFMGYLANSQETRTTLAGLQGDTERERNDVAVLEGSIGNLGLDQQNREVAFLNRKIDERTFSWSLLFDRMAEVLPKGVRLLRLSPSNLVQKDAEAALRAGREPKPQPIVLAMSCEAKDDEALLRFVDNLFAHPAFSEPNLASEQREDDGLVRFEVSVQYLPEPPRHEPDGAATANGALPETSSETPTTPQMNAGIGARPTSPAGAGLMRVAPPAGGMRRTDRGAARRAPRRPGAPSVKILAGGEGSPR